MTLPVVALDSPSPSPPSSPSTNVRELPVILVVEDEPAPMKMMETSLTARHYHVVAATTGAAALERVAADEPDVMIVDLGLPDFDGLNLCRHLRLWSKSPIVVVTADGSQERMVQALDECTDDHIVKPFSMEELLARVRVALRHRNLRSPADAAPSIVVGALTLDVEGHIAIGGRFIRCGVRRRTNRLHTRYASSSANCARASESATAPLGS